ncbi:hypothetical protein [Streptomyces anulatus]|uniref:hypothetical protein n=1 Tax=Streptomyces anulatus TaxID=1892 RepID=UPI001C26B099|nr:hypothetical protein [Streptomyces anulatus]
MKQKSSHIRSTENRARTLAVQNLRRSGASGHHASGTNRQRDRNGAKRAAIRYSSLSG